MDNINDVFVEQRYPVTVTIIENGYLVSSYQGGQYLQYYCIDEHEIVEELLKFL